MKKAITIIILILINIASASDYFQQQVDYRISAQLVPGENMVKGTEEIVYHNNSRSKLDTLYFHLYLNAFKPGSNFDTELDRRGSHRMADFSAFMHGGMIINRIMINDHEPDGFIIDDTILKLPLAGSLLPGDSLLLYFDFESIIPARGYRLGRRGSHFDVGQWYPKAAVYDNYGWHINQFQSMSEQYSDFGNYDIRVTAPENYILAHTGSHLNETEVFGGMLKTPKEGRVIYDLLNEIDDHNSAAGFDDLFDSIMLDWPFRNLTDYNDDETKTWIFRAENVHDFAFSAATDFVLDRAVVDGVIVDCYYKSNHRRNWSPRAIDTAVEAMRYFNNLVGPYPYDHYTLVSSTVYGGIEYPSLSMVIMYGGRDIDDHGFENVIAHELAHNWFFGAIASNQAEQAFIDEGFTTYLTTRFIEHKYGRYDNNHNYQDKWKKRLVPTGDYRNDMFKNYAESIYEGYQEKSNQPANRFKTMTTYRNATYSKPTLLVYHLQYILGDEKFNEFLHELYARYKSKHVYLGDIENLATEIYGGNIRYFFNQWYDDTAYLDFGLNGVKLRLVSDHGVNWYQADFKLKRYGKAISPLDIVVSYENGETDTVMISERVWADGRINYIHTVNLPLKPIHAELNPDCLIPDINRMNNNWKWPKARFQFDTPRIFFEDAYIEHYPESYTLYHQPKFWYNEVDGVKPGYSLDGSYLGVKHDMEARMDIGTLSGEIDYNIHYGDILSMKYPTLRYIASASKRDGRSNQGVDLSYRMPVTNRTSTFEATLSLNRLNFFDRDYLVSPYSWETGDIVTFELNLKRHRDYYRMSTDYRAHLMSAAPGSEFNFNRLTLAFDFSGELSRHGKVLVGLMHGYSEGEVPVSHLFNNAGASALDYYGNNWYSARGTLPGAWYRNGHLFLDDGFSMPGYLNRGNSGKKKLAARIELELANPLVYFDLTGNPVTDQLAKITNRVYVNHGAIWNDGGFPGSDDFDAEGGLHFLYELPYWERLFGDQKLHLYLPLLVSSPYQDENTFKFRWALMIAR